VQHWRPTNQQLCTHASIHFFCHDPELLSHTAAGLPCAHEYDATKIRRLFSINQDAVFSSFVHAFPHFEKAGGGVFVGNASITAGLPDAVMETGGSAIGFG
jgi:hypothetical protein